MPSHRQTNFLGGELDPLLWGRTDHPLFDSGLRTMRNFFASKHGAAVSRPGSLYLGACKSTDGEPNVRLVPFVYSDDLAYALEVGVVGGRFYIRFWADGAQVQATYLRVDSYNNAATPANPDFVAGNHITGGTSGAKARIVAVVDYDFGSGPEHALQLADVVGGANSGLDPGLFNGSETISEDETGNTYDVVPAIGGEQTAAYEVLAGTTAADLAQLKWAQAGAAIHFAHPDLRPVTLTRIAADEWALSSTPFATANPYFAGDASPTIMSPLPTVDATHPEREWEFYVSLSVRDDATGKRFETQAWRVTDLWDGNIVNPAVPLAIPQKYAIYPDRPLTILTQAHIPLDVLNVLDDSYTVESVNYYRGQGSEVGWIGATTLFGEFIDLGQEPDYTFPPLLGALPFQTSAYVGTVPPDQYPAALAFFQERLAYAATLNEPNAVWLSATGDYTCFDLPLVTHHAGEALLFELAAHRREATRHLFPDAKLLVFTGSSSWSLAGVQGGALDWNSVDARLEDGVGASHVPPVKIGSVILFARTKGAGVRGLSFSGDDYVGADVSNHAQHLFLGETVLDGTTYEKTIVDWTFAEDPWGLLWICRADGALLSLTHIGEHFAWARHDCDDARFLRVCAVPETTEDAVYMLVQRSINGFAVNCIERQASRVQRNNADDDCCVDCAVKVTVDPTDTSSLSAADVLAGKAMRIDVPHLSGQTVWLCGVGNIPLEFTVDDGSVGYGSIPGITLDEAPTANNVGADEATLYVGLRFQPELETLDAVSAESRQKKRIVRRVGIELDQSTGIYFGATFDDLRTSKPNTVAAGYLAPSKATALVAFDVPDKWSDSGKACVRQTLPLPVTVVGLTRDLVFGD